IQMAACGATCAPTRPVRISTASGWPRGSSADRKSCSWARRWRRGGSTLFSTCTATRACLTFSATVARGCPRARRSRPGGAVASVGGGVGTGFVRARPELQQVHGYPDDKDTKVNMSLASKYVGHSFGCLSLTLEMPFKDNANLRDPEVGWNGERSRRLGAASLEAMLAVLPEL